MAEHAYNPNIVAWVGVLGRSTKAYHKVFLGSQASQNILFMIQWETLFQGSKTQSYRERHLESCTGLHWHTHTHTCTTHTYGREWERQREKRTINYIIDKLTPLWGSSSVSKSSDFTWLPACHLPQKVTNCAKKYWWEDIYIFKSRWNYCEVYKTDVSFFTWLDVSEMNHQMECTTLRVKGI